MATSEIVELEAYIINTKIIKRADVIITALTPIGIQTIYGRGYASIKNKNHILTNRGIKVKLYGKASKSYFRLSDFDLLSSDNLLTLDYEIYETYTKIVKLVMYIDSIIDNVGFQLFDFCVSNMENYQQQLLIDLWKVYVLKHENIILNFNTCMHCASNQQIVTLSLLDGGLICNKCYSGQRIISENDIKHINAFYKSKIGLLKAGYSSDVSRFLSELVEQSVGLKIE